MQNRHPRYTGAIVLLSIAAFLVLDATAAGVIAVHDAPPGYEVPLWLNGVWVAVGSVVGLIGWARFAVVRRARRRAAVGR